MRMKWLFAAGAAWACVMLPAGGAMASADQFREGVWEYSVEYRMLGSPLPFPTYTERQCLTRKDPIPRISRQGVECRVTPQVRFDRSFTWQLDCSSEWEMVQGMGRIHYRPDDTFRSDLHVQVLGPNNPAQTLHFALEGKRVDACP